MNFSAVQVIIPLLGSFGFGSIITILVSRRKLKADTQLAITQTYSMLTQDLREQVRMQGEQILNLQKKETEGQKKEAQYLKMIGQHQIVERELRKRIKALETQIQKLQTQIL